MSVSLFVAAPILLAMFLVKGVALPIGPVVRVRAQPLRFAAYCALYLIPILFQAFLFHREHPIARDSVWLLICAGNVVLALRPRREWGRKSSLSKYEFATISEPPRPQTGFAVLHVILGCLCLILIILRAVDGRYAVPL